MSSPANAGDPGDEAAPHVKKEDILSEIKRVAAENGGKPPGRLAFEAEAGIREHEWRGRHWARWSDAIREAGLEPNQKSTAYGERYLIEQLIELIRALGHFPTSSELRLKATNSPDFPSEMAFRRFGGKQQLVARTLAHAKSRSGCDDVLVFCEAASSNPPSTKTAEKISESANGFVYLLKSGRFYKIGRSNAVGRRERELTIQLPEKASTVHSIRTDDPVGIEAYWHTRFESKRKNGEWFDLTPQDVSAFRRRKFM